MSKIIIETDKAFDTVKFFRNVKEKIAKETEGMSFAELKEYINKRKIKHGKKSRPHNKQYDISCAITTAATYRQPLCLMTKSRQKNQDVIKSV